MPRTKKAAGTAVDRRNGRRAEIGAAAPIGKFSLPKRTDGRAWSLETKKAWTLVWQDPVSRVWSVADRPVLLRWAEALHRAEWSLKEADADPIATGSMGQAVESPYYGIADKAVRVVQACEAQLGVGPLNRSRLGLEFTSAQRSLAELNAMFTDEDDDEPDARL